MSAIEETIRQIVADELNKHHQREELQSISEFCKAKKISRITVWRAEKEGRLKLVRIGRKVFINPGQFAVGTK